MSDETRYVGQKLDYRPELTYTPPKIYGTGFPELSNEVSPEVRDYSNVKDITKTVTDIYGQVRALRLKAEAMLPTLLGILPEDYIKALSDPQDLEAYDLIDRYEEAAADINGTAAAELYRDLLNMEADWAYTNEIVVRALHNQLGTNLTAEELEKRENELIQSASSLTYQRDQLANKAFDAFAKDEDTDHIQTEINSIEESLRDFSRRMATMRDVTLSLTIKCSDAEEVIARFDAAIQNTPQNSFNGDLAGAMRPLVSMIAGDSKENATKNLTMLSASVRMPIDRKAKQIVTDMRLNTDQLSKEKREAVGEGLCDMVHIRNEVVGQDLRVLTHLSGYDNSDAVLAVGSIVDHALLEHEGQYQQKILDYCRFNTLSQGYYLEHVNRVDAKQQERDLYWVIRGIADQIATSGVVPTPETSESWIEGFIQANGYLNIYDPETRQVVAIGG